MHIPDGYLSPQTCTVMGALMLPIWITAGNKVKKTLKTKNVPLIAIGAAFSFTIMMYNIPIPGGTTAHAIGAGLLAIVLGPWASTIAITIALAIQALLFGDGGILVFGANTFNIAFVPSFTAYYIYKLVAGNSEVTSKRRWIGGFLGSYVGINLAALVTAIEFGIQPELFHAADGTALYCPYPLSMAIPAMVFTHALFAGPLEGVVTALVIRYFQSGSSNLLSPESSIVPIERGGYRKLWWALAILVIGTPIGLLAQGTAWGEWSLNEIRDKIGVVPQGMDRLSESWHAPLPDYTIPGLNNSFLHSTTGYIISAVGGLLIIMAATYFFSQVQKKTKNNL